MNLIRVLTGAGILACVVIGSVGSASAEPLNGPYTRTVTSKTGGPYHIGGQTPWILSSCGATCLHVHQAADPEWDVDLQLEGNAWAGRVARNRTTTFDKDTLLGTDTMTHDNGTVWTVQYTLTKG